MAAKRIKDQELWEKVKKTIKPLQSNRAGQDFVTEMEKIENTAGRQIKSPTRIVRPYRPEQAARVSLISKPAVLDQSTTRKIAKGRTSIEGRLDLHGLTQNEAYSKLYSFLETARFSGKRTVLVITGKGVRGEGILRHAVPRWLSEPAFRAITTGYHEAHITHGGSGALYVRLRRLDPIV